MTKRLKYSEDVYKDYDPLFNDETSFKIPPISKLVVTRKEHSCVECGKKIEKGDYAWYCSGLPDDGDGWCSFYLCIDCVDEDIKMQG